MNLSIRRLKAAAAFFAGALRSPRLAWLKRRANGMLPLAVYRELYDRVRALPDGDIVEVGAGAGAGSAAIARAMQDSGKRSTLIVIEKCEGGSRSDFGGHAQNERILRRTVARFGVADRVILWPHPLTLESGPEVLATIETPELAALIHDADGRIDRDFALFWPRLRPGGLIVIDDDENAATFRPPSEWYPQGGIKPLMTHRLLAQFTEWGLFEPEVRIGATVFGRKPERADFSAFDPSVCARIVAGVERERDAFLQRA